MRVSAAIGCLILCFAAITGAQAPQRGPTTPRQELMRGGPGPKPSAPSVKVSTTLPTPLIELRSVTLGVAGFEPTEIRLKAPRLVLVIQKKPAVSQVRLLIEQQESGQFRSVNIESREVPWAEIWELKPGSYRFTRLDDPTKVLRVTLNPK